MMKFLKPANIALGLIWLYRKTVSPWMFPCCRFTPTCSEYAQEAFRRHGFFTGSALSAWRLLRCNPFCRCGHDPVPDRPSKDDHKMIGMEKMAR